MIRKTVLVAALTVASTAALAQAALPNPPAGAGTLLDVGQAFSIVVQPYVNAAIQTILAAGLGWLAWWLKKKWGIEVDKGHRDAVQTWLTNQASSLVADGAVKIENGRIVVNQQVLTQHALQITKQMPDAATYFKISPEMAASKITDKLPQVPAVASMMAVDQAKK